MARAPTAKSRRAASGAVTAGIVAGLIWGLAFLIPVLLGGWNPVIVTVGRYLVLGALSAVLLGAGGRSLRQAARQHWRAALAFAVTGNVGYYLLMVIAIRAAGAPLTDMVIGVIPVTVAVAGNWVSPVYPWRRLGLPLVLVTLGLALVSALEITGVHAYQPGPVSAKVAGLGAACGAVVLWTWYALANARFLARHDAISPAAWSTVVGAATGVVALAGLPLAAATGQLATPSTGAAGIAKLITAAVILGVVVSWAGTWLWNSASSRLPAAMSGLLVNVETIAGFGYVYAAKLAWPGAGQLTGLLLLITGVAIMVHRQRPKMRDAGRQRECWAGLPRAQLRTHPRGYGEGR